MTEQPACYAADKHGAECNCWTWSKLLQSWQPRYSAYFALLAIEAPEAHALAEAQAEPHPWDTSWKGIHDLAARAEAYRHLTGYQGKTEVAVYSCFHCGYYIGKCKAESFPTEELPVCRTCREQHGYSDRPIYRTDFTGHPSICGYCEMPYSEPDWNHGSANLHHRFSGDCYDRQMAEGTEAQAPAASEHDAWHIIYRYSCGGGNNEVVYGPSAAEAIEALRARSVQWADLRIIHGSLCWCPEATAERAAAELAARGLPPIAGGSEANDVCAACGTPFVYCPADPEERRIFCRARCWGHCPYCRRPGTSRPGAPFGPPIAGGSGPILPRFRAAAPRAEQEETAEQIAQHIDRLGPISINGTNDPSAFALGAVRARKGPNRWGIEGHFTDGYGQLVERHHWMWLSDVALRIIADQLARAEASDRFAAAAQLTARGCPPIAGGSAEADRFCEHNYLATACKRCDPLLRAIVLQYGTDAAEACDHGIPAAVCIRHRPDAIDTVAAVELDLFAQTTGQLYPMRCNITNNLLRKLARGTYDAALAPRAWLHWYDEAARHYVREHGGHLAVIFPRRVRLQAAEDQAAHEYLKMTRGEYTPKEA